ncbi:Ig-like domain repeat protein [Kitasatospora sp. NPDC006697]|uniref:Ig-like domain repeat protein n=1 Tax=Kitasatospora sp. NPDC006697 TaxID=3364020 RepID=UPI00368A4EBE
MKFNRISRTVALGAATMLAAGSVTLLSAVTAQADTSTIGTLTVNPASGADTTAIDVVSSAACPGGTNLQVLVFGQGFPAAGYGATPNTPQSSITTTANGGYDVPLSDTMASFAQKNGFTTLSGQYDFHLRCQAKIGATYYGDFVGSITFTSPTAYVSTTVTPPAPGQTATALAVTPSGSATVGGSVTLTATVTPAAAGSVQFMDGTTALGTPVTVAGGTASLSTTALALGAHSLSAVFTSTDSHFLGSTSAASAYTVSPKAAAPTTTALGVTPSGSASKGTAIQLTATVSPAAAGTVQFMDGTTALGSPVTVSGGTALYSATSLAEGDHSLSAAFTPADATAFAASVSATVPLAITPVVLPPDPGQPTPPAPVGENLITTVAPGALVISVADGNVTLPPLTLNSKSTYYATAGALQTVTVTDTRAGAPGWSCSGQVAQFTSNGNAINAENLGWAPNLVSKGDGMTVNVGGRIAPANAVAAGDPGALGLKSSRTLATATGLGTAQLGADLTLLAPTSTLAGTYQGVLTLTAI